MKQIALTSLFSSWCSFCLIHIYPSVHLCHDFQARSTWKGIEKQCSAFWRPLTISPSLSQWMTPSHHPTHPLTFAWNKLFDMTTMWVHTSCDQGSSCRTEFTFLWKGLWEALLQRTHHIPQVSRPPSQPVSFFVVFFYFLTIMSQSQQSSTCSHSIVKTRQYNIITFIITELEIIITGCHIPQPSVSDVNMWAIHWRRSWTLKNTLKCS